MANPIFLNEEQLRGLATLIYYQEVDAIKTINFHSEYEQANYLAGGRAAFESVGLLLDTGVHLKLKFHKDRVRSPISHNIFSYIVNGLNNALQLVPNFTLRKDYIKKITDLAKALIDDLEKLDINNASKVKVLEEEADGYNHVMVEFAYKYRSTAPSRNFSRSLKEKNFTFEEMVRTYQAVLKYEGSFEDLEDEQKIKVYDKILEASGRGTLISKMNWIIRSTKLSTRIAGIFILLFSLGKIVWEIYNSEHVLLETTKTAVQAVAGFGGAVLGKVIGTAIASAVTSAQASAGYMALAGVIGGFAGAFVLGFFAGWMIDFIISSGGKIPLSTDGLRAYIAPMPDGETLALQIAHKVVLKSTNYL